MTAGPTWYDLLDVEPGASTEEVRAAWKAAIADLDPTDRRFQRLSDAAAVLLDPEARRAYDARVLRGGAPASEASGVRIRTDSGTDSGGGQGSGLPPATAAASVGQVRGTEPGTSGVEPAPADPVAAEPGTRSARAPRTVPLWALGVLAAVALVLVAVAAYAWTRPDPEAIEAEAGTARGAAERAVVPVLSYDYRTLAAGRRAAESRMTPRYRDKAYRPLFATIEKNAPTTRTVVTTRVVESAVVRAQQDRVQVLLLVDRPTTNAKQTTPVTYEDHVTVTMEKTDGGWLIDDMTT